MWKGVAPALSAHKTFWIILKHLLARPATLTYILDIRRRIAREATSRSRENSCPPPTRSTGPIGRPSAAAIAVSPIRKPQGTLKNNLIGCLMAPPDGRPPAGAPRGSEFRGRGRGKGRGGNSRGRGAHRGRGGGGAGGQRAQQAEVPSTPLTHAKSPKPAVVDDNDADDDAEVCFICANPIKYTSVAPCNHKSCHVCALRMRALYKNKDCPHCRVRLQFSCGLGI